MSDNLAQISFTRPAPVPRTTAEPDNDHRPSGLAGKARGGLSRRAATRAEAFLTENIARAIRIDDVAAECGLSPAHFARAFRESMGQSPHRWLIERRVARAQDLLLTSQLAIVDIALECGFSDQSHLTRLFADVTGLPPAAWRRRHRAMADVGRFSNS